MNCNIKSLLINPNPKTLLFFSPDEESMQVSNLSNENRSFLSVKSTGTEGAEHTSAKTSPSIKVKHELEINRPILVTNLKPLPAIKVIPIVKISPAVNDKQVEQNRNPTRPKSGVNQLLVPNGGSPRRGSNVTQDSSMGSSEYGSTTMRVNPLDKSCITQVANMKKRGPVAEIVTCTTCFPIPLLHKLVKRSNS